jgi:hypothetical protein
MFWKQPKNNLLWFLAFSMVLYQCRCWFTGLPPSLGVDHGGGAFDDPVSRRLTAWRQQNLVAVDLAGSSYQNAALKAAVCSAALILTNLKVPNWVFLIPAHIG